MVVRIFQAGKGSLPFRPDNHHGRVGHPADRPGVALLDLFSEPSPMVGEIEKDGARILGDHAPRLVEAPSRLLPVSARSFRGVNRCHGGDRRLGHCRTQCCASPACSRKGAKRVQLRARRKDKISPLARAALASPGRNVVETSPRDRGEVKLERLTPAAVQVTVGAAPAVTPTRTRPPAWPAPARPAAPAARPAPAARTAALRDMHDIGAGR